MIGPRIVPVLNTAMARPWRSGGLICNSVACDNGASPAPATPCNARKRTSSPRLVAAPHSAEARVKPMTESKKIYFDAEPAGEPAGQRHHDRGADDIRGQARRRAARSRWEEEHLQPSGWLRLPDATHRPAPVA